MLQTGLKGGIDFLGIRINITFICSTILILQMLLNTFVKLTINNLKLIKWKKIIR